MEIENRRIHLSYSVASLCVVAQFLIGYDGVNYITSAPNAVIVILIIALVEVKIYSKVGLKTFIKEYWIAMGVASVLSHAVAYAVVCLRGDFSVGLFSFLGMGIISVLSFLVVALPPFLIVLALLRYVPRSFLSGEST